jgi:hypothetical protein
MMTEEIRAWEGAERREEGSRNEVCGHDGFAEQDDLSMLAGGSGDCY